MFIALMVIALTALLAWPVSRQLVRPIRELSAGTRRLAAGAYDTRLTPGPRDELGQLAAAPTLRPKGSCPRLTTAIKTAIASNTDASTPTA